MLLVAAVLAALPAVAQTPPVLLDLARQAIATGHFDDARRILAAVPMSGVDPNDLDFLLGTLALAENDFPRAVERFRAILARDPDLQRVRLDLARAYFMDGDDEAAIHHFRIAAASGLPPEVEAKVDGFLAAIKRRRHLSIDAGLGLAPDSNVNAATVVKTVNLFGIPFLVDQNAQKKSGVGVVGSLAGSYQFEMGEDSRLVVGGGAVDNDYQGNRFDDRLVNVFAGPRFLLGDDAEVTLKGTGFRRWYGGRTYSLGGGLRLEGQATLSPRWMVDGSVDLQQVEYDQFSLLNGPVGTVSLGLNYGLDGASYVRLATALAREQTREATFRDLQYFVETDYYREFPLGFTGILGANADYARYDRALAGFGRTRHDLTVNYRVGVANSAVDLWGFTPVVSYIHTNRYSDLGFYSYDRDRAELTIKRNF